MSVLSSLSKLLVLIPKNEGVSLFPFHYILSSFYIVSNNTDSTKTICLVSCLGLPFIRFDIKSKLYEKRMNISISLTLFYPLFQTGSNIQLNR